MNNIVSKEDIKIEEMIYEISGKKVMIDSDLANLYGVETKRINEAVSNNPLKFPDRFSWKLSNEEQIILRSKFSTSRNNTYGGTRYNARVFTEQGIAMLATILKSKVATEVSISIMDAYVAMRQYITSSILSNNIEYKILEHDKRINLLEEAFNKFKEKNNSIFFEGQIYDAYSLLIEILNKSIKEIIIIDNYAGKELLDILKNIDKKIAIISKNVNKELINIYTKQYGNVIFINNNSFHDRFIILDKKTLYHCGSSFKDLGKKCFAISRIDDLEILENIIKKLT
ncbi:MAG TPA: ORF6N domain-containing protein [Bacilli bacterium]|nr:ORF6N domain-containing protein [Bacilli bacterium]